MIASIADNLFSNYKYGTNHQIDRENFAIYYFASMIRVDNRSCGCQRFTTCNHPSIEKINRLKDGL